MEDCGRRSVGSLDDGVKRDAENNIMKLNVFLNVHHELTLH